MRPTSALFLLLVSGLAAQDTPKAFLGATLVNPGKDPIPDATVLIHRGKVIAAGPSAKVKVPKEAQRVDARGKWITPGLMDAHIHFFQSGGLYTRPDAFDFREHRSYEAETANINRDLPDTFARYLRCGITGVIDLGGPYWNFSVKARASVAPAAPRVWLSGPLITPGPVLNRVTGKPSTHFLMTGQDPSVIQGGTEEAARAEVRRQVAMGADFIKIWVWRGEATPAAKATIDEAHKLGKKVVVHATELEGATAAVKAGADVLAHSVEDKPISGELLALMKQRGVIITPTLLVKKGYVVVRNRRYHFEPWEFALANPYVMGTLFDPLYLPGKLTEEQAKQIREAKPWTPSSVTVENLKRMHRAGILIAAGTDAGNPGTFPGPSLYTELNLMAQVGVPTRDLLTFATLNGARLAGQEREVGSLEPGKRADLLLLDADPLADILNLRRIHRIVKDGQDHDPATLIRDTPEDVVQRQLNAYNARDIEAFAATYAPDVSIRSLPEGLSGYEGRDKLHARYEKLFQERPDQGVSITTRTRQGSFVIDQEHFTHRFDPEQVKPAGTAVYEVRNGLIQTVWFLQDRPAVKP